MKKHITFIVFLLIAVATSAQTLNGVTDNVTYAFPASKVGEMIYKDGTTLTIGGKVFTISDINKIYVDDSEVTDNEVAVTYNSTNATVTVAGNVAQYVTPTVSGAHVSIVQSNTDDVDGNEITYSLSGASSDGEFYMSGKYKCSIDLNGVSLTNKTPVYSGAALHIQKDFRDVGAVVGEGQLPLGTGLLDKLVVGVLQKILEKDQVLQVSQCISPLIKYIC